jgi:hypothetical protein
MSNHPPIRPRGPQPSQDSDAFKYWQAKNALPEAALLQSLAMAQDCIELLQAAAIGYTDEPFPRVVLDPAPNDDVSN